MKYVIENQTDLELLTNFIQTDDPVYVYNLLLRYFYYNMCIELNRYEDLANFNISTLTEFLIFYKENYEKLTNWHQDHTLYYALDVNSNVELFRHFLKYPWEQWNDKTILEVGAGFGIYVFLFNLIKTYYNLNTRIKAYDFSEYKINKIKQVGNFLQWNNTVYTIADCCLRETFKDCVDDDIVLIYSETFSRRVGKEPYFRIMQNIIQKCSDLIRTPYILFPKDFIIEGEHTETTAYINHMNEDAYIQYFLVNEKYQSLIEFDVDEETTKLTNYIQHQWGDCIGFRWTVLNKRIK